MSVAEPYLQDADVTLYCGDALEVLRELPDESVHMCCTSPPFYGLRDYGTEGQIGLEPTPDEWVQALVDVFREVRRVLRRDGTCWVEIGEKFDAKRLLGTPWKLAFALAEDDWYLRSEIIWAKPNPMPESVTDRPTQSHSRVFLLAKGPRYFYDSEAIREPHDSRFPMEHHSRVGAGNNKRAGIPGVREGPTFSGPRQYHPAGRNRRSVWTIATEPYPEAHFATWPTRLVEPMILAGTSERGVCPECGAPWERITESELVKSPAHGAGSTVRGRGEGTDVNGWAGEAYPRLNKETTTVGWQPTCECHGWLYRWTVIGDDGKPDTLSVYVFPNQDEDYQASRLEPPVCLDPFGGSGTTAHVARKHSRKAILIELNPTYCELAAKRLAQQSLLA